MKSRLLRASHLAARWAPPCLLAPLPVLAQALPGRLAVWLTRPARPAQPGAEWKEPPP